MIRHQQRVLPRGGCSALHRESLHSDHVAAAQCGLGRTGDAAGCRGDRTGPGGAPGAIEPEEAECLEPCIDSGAVGAGGGVGT